MAGMFETDLPLKVADLGDKIFIAESEKVPFSRLLKRGKKPVNMLCEWDCQKYEDLAFQGTLDGSDMSSYSHSTRETLRAYGMFLRTAGWLVSKLAQLVKTADVKNEAAKQASDDSLSLARMIEKQLLSQDETAAESGSTAYCNRGVFKWLQNGAQAVQPVPSDFRPASACCYTGAIGDFLPSHLITMLKAMANAKKAPVDLTGIVGIDVKSQMSTWAQRDPDAEADEAAALVSYNLNASEKKLIQAVNTFEFDSGNVTTFPSFYLAHTNSTGAATAYTPKSGIFIDLDMWELCFYQNPMSWKNPDLGGGPRGYHDAVYISKSLNPLGQGYILSNS